MTDQSLTRFLASDSGDTDPSETQEWRDAFLALVASEGPERARFILDQLATLARDPRVGWSPELVTPYVNTVPVEKQPAFPGDLAIEERLASIMRWNALAMVVRANTAYGELGGHIARMRVRRICLRWGSTTISFGTRQAIAPETSGRRPRVLPAALRTGGVRAGVSRGPVEEKDLAHYRQEITAPKQGARGLSSYPHPWLMPDFWQFPTGSMGIGPISSIYHARFMRYLTHRQLLDCTVARCGVCSATARWTSPSR